MAHHLVPGALPECGLALYTCWTNPPTCAPHGALFSWPRTHAAPSPAGPRHEPHMAAGPGPPLHVALALTGLGQVPHAAQALEQVPHAACVQASGTRVLCAAHSQTIQSRCNVSWVQHAGWRTVHGPSLPHGAGLTPFI